MKKRVMLIAAHPDDAEIGMGGTIAALTDAGHELVLVDLTDGEPTPFGSKEIRAAESAEASKILGIKNRTTLDIKNREVYDTVENRKKVANLIREYKPDVLFGPYWDDAHPDHIQAHALTVAARFYSKFVKSDLLHQAITPPRLLHYFSTHIRLKFQPSFVYDITGTFNKKMSAINAYQSQFSANANNKTFLKNIELDNAYWGSQIGTQYGEAFASRDNIRISDTEALLKA